MSQSSYRASQAIFSASINLSQRTLAPNQEVGFLEADVILCAMPEPDEFWCAITKASGMSSEAKSSPLIPVVMRGVGTPYFLRKP